MMRDAAGRAVLTAAQMRAAEHAAIAGGLSEYELMERAGAAAAEYAWRIGGKRETLVLCGPGNNGGDGYVIARYLKARGVPVRVAASAYPRTESALKARANWGGSVGDIATVAPAPHLIDALFGTGLTRALEPALADRLNALGNQAAKVTAIDLPSGIEADGGAILSPVPRATLCVALGALKPAHMLEPARGTFAALVVADIGIDLSQATAHVMASPLLCCPDADAHKYSRGLAAIVGGALPGASMLSARAAAHAGAGYIKLITEVEGRSGPDAIVTLPARTAEAVGQLIEDRRIDALLCGPGLGRDTEARGRLEAVLAAGKATVLDADALHLYDGEPLTVPGILTPHEGEFRKLFGDMPGGKPERAAKAAERLGCVVIYKGPDTIVAAPDGRLAYAPIATSWLSTAGTGDVLAGIVVARLAATGDPFLAACEAVWLHCEAARRAGAAFIADDLIAQIPAAIASRL